MRQLRLFEVLVFCAAFCLVWGCGDDDDNGNGATDGSIADVAAADGGTSDTGGGGDGGVEGDSSITVELSCESEAPCVACCPQDDTACADACVAAMSAEAKQARDDFETCRLVTCADECSGEKQQCIDCLNTQCATEWAACNWDPKGSKTCTEVFDCTSECPPLVLDQSGDAETCPTEPGLVCIQACNSEGDEEGSDLANIAGGCMYQNCNAECAGAWQSTACTTCRDENCATEWQACSDDT